MPINNGIINQKGTPAFFSDIFANRPAFGYAGRVFISTDTGAIYEDTGTAWTLIADAGAGTTGTLQQVTTNGNTTTNSIQVQGIDFSDGAGTGLYNIAIGNQTMGANTTGSQNIAIGYQVLKFNTTGTLNVAIGTTALTNNTTGAQNTAIGQLALNLNTTGAQNTALGNATLQNNTTGIGNTAIGHASLVANTTANYNTAIGQDSLRSNTTGDGNVAIGYRSQFTNTIGVNNSALGYNSLRLNTTGGNNTAIGTNALQNNTTASDNTAIGNNSLNANTTGTQNTAIGGSTLIVNTTGFGNSAMGYGTMASNTTGQLNIGIGGGSLAANTTGNNNTAIGSFAGSLITTGSNNTILGYYQGTPTLASNIVLADGLGNVRLFSDANGLIGINQAVGSTIGGQLDIHTAQTYALVLNGLTTNNAYTAFSNNNVGKWRIGNTYNAGANSFDIHNLTTTSNALSILSTNNFVGIGISTPATRFNVSGSTTASAGAGIGSTFNQTIVAAANSDTLIGLNIAPTITPGAFTSVQSHALSVTGLNSTIGMLRWTDAATAVGFLGVTAGLPYIHSNNSVLAFGASGSNAFSETFRIANTNLLVGSTTDNTFKLQVYSNTGIYVYNAGADNTVVGNGSVQVNTANSSDSASSSANVRIGNYTTSRYWDIQQDTSSNLRLFAFNAGWTTAGTFSASTGVYTPLSDINKKKDFEQSNLGLNSILGLKPTLYRMKNEDNTEKHLGFIAQEVKEFIPQAYNVSGDFIGLDYQAITATIVKAIQELNEKLVRNNIN